MVSEWILTQGLKLETVAKQSKAWSLVFKVKPFDIVHSWTSIIRATIGGDKEHYGDRNPAIFFEPSTTKIQIKSAVNGSQNYLFEPCIISLPLYTYTDVNITQSSITIKKYLTTIKINGTTCDEVINTDAREFDNVIVYASDIWDPAAKATIKDYSFENLPNGKYTDKMKN